MSCPSILMWNFRGAVSSRFRRHLKFLLSVNNPSFLILVETRVSSSCIGSLLRKSALDSYFALEACGFANGISVCGILAIMSVN